MLEATRTKDNLADLINVALEELVRCRFELPATTFWSAWQDLKRDPASPTLTHMKLLIAHLVSISERRNLLAPDLFTGVPHGKIKQFAAEAKTLAAARMREMLPRILNWKDLKLCRPSQDAHYTHIDELFSDIVDWDLIETHLPDMLRVVLSVAAGMIRPSTLLRKLGTYSRKNKLYQTFREMGNVVRTEFLLHLLADPELRSTLLSAMNKSEAFNGFAKWVLFGGEGVIAENRREEQRKIIKFNHLVANCVILYNVFVVSKELRNCSSSRKRAVNSTSRPSRRFPLTSDTTSTALDITSSTWRSSHHRSNTIFPSRRKNARRSLPDK